MSVKKPNNPAVSHDQNFKNLILDYKIQALQFFAPEEAKGLDEHVRVIPIRQEMLKDRLGDRFRALDTPLMLEWPDGQKEAVVIILEEESVASEFSIHRLVGYCASLSDLLKTDKIVPVVIFLRPGKYPKELHLGGHHGNFLSFRYLCCDLKQTDAEDYLNSDNIVARLTLPNMRYNEKDKVKVYAAAVSGLLTLESRTNYQYKYIDFIDEYAKLTDTQLAQYKRQYVDGNDEEKDKIMGLLQHTRNEGMQQGMQQGVQLGESVVLFRLLEQRFGQISDQVRHKVEAADCDTLLGWAENILTAKTIDEVFH